MTLLYRMLKLGSVSRAILSFSGLQSNRVRVESILDSLPGEGRFSRILRWLSLNDRSQSSKSGAACSREAACAASCRTLSV